MSDRRSDSQPVVVDGQSLSLEDLERVAAAGAEVVLTPELRIRERIAKSWSMTEALVDAGRVVYGVTTGPGLAVDTQIGGDRAEGFQSNLVRFLGCGVGPYLSEEECRASVLARVNCFARGYSGVRPALIDRLMALLNRGVTPCIPALGSVGASGDLVPSSYIAAVLMGEREVYFEGRICPASEAMVAAGIEPIRPAPKEALALVNGTTVMTAIAGLASEAAARLLAVADACTALTVEVLQGVSGAFDPFIHEIAKGHDGQRISATRVRTLLEGSELVQQYEEVVDAFGTLSEGRRQLDTPIQDHYSVRCAPQCIGAVEDAMTWIRSTLTSELNSSHDNPLFDPDAGRVHSGGNFSGFHVGMAADTLKVGVSSVADLLDRQFALVVDAQYNRGLGVGCRHPLPDEHPEAGTHYGFRGMQLVISALTAEALNAATPMTTFSRSTACHNQDKVSMATIAARQAREIVKLTEQVAAIHLLLLAQAADLRGPERLGAGCRAVYDAVRNVSAYVAADRELAADIERVRGLISSGVLAKIVTERSVGAG